MVIISSLVEVLLLRPLTCLIITIVTMIKRKVKSKEIMLREIDEVKEELGLNKSDSKDLSSSRHLGLHSQAHLDKHSKSDDLEGQR